MRRAPAKPVRACILRKWCPVSRVTFEAPLRTSHFSLHSSHSTLHASHSTLHTSHCTLKTPDFTLHTSHFTVHTSLHTALLRLLTSHSTLHTSQSTLQLLTAFFTLHTSHSTLHTAPFTPHTSHCTLHTPHFISSELFSPHPSSSLFICHLSFHESLPSTITKELACAVRQPGPCVRALREAVAVLLSKRTWPAHDPGAMQRQANTFLTLHTALFTLHTCTSISTHLIWALLISFHVLHKTRSSTTLYYKACTKYFPVLLCTTKLAQTTSQYWLMSITKACTNYFPFVVQTTSQYYFVHLCTTKLAHTLLPSTTLYYKACTKHFPALLCTTKLAENTSQYYFVLQSLHKARPSTTFVLQSLHKVVLGSVFCKLCSTKVVLGRALCKLCSTK